MYKSKRCPTLWSSARIRDRIHIHLDPSSLAGLHVKLESYSSPITASSHQWNQIWIQDVANDISSDQPACVSNRRSQLSTLCQGLCKCLFTLYCTQSFNTLNLPLRSIVMISYVHEPSLFLIKPSLFLIKHANANENVLVSDIHKNTLAIAHHQHVLSFHMFLFLVHFVTVHNVQVASAECSTKPIPYYNVIMFCLQVFCD